MSSDLHTTTSCGGILQLISWYLTNVIQIYIPLLHVVVYYNWYPDIWQMWFRFTYCYFMWCYITTDILISDRCDSDLHTATSCGGILQLISWYLTNVIQIYILLLHVLVHYNWYPDIWQMWFRFTYRYFMWWYITTDNFSCNITPHEVAVCKSESHLSDIRIISCNIPTHEVAVCKSESHLSDIRISVVIYHHMK
jgi:hypothetical protein